MKIYIKRFVKFFFVVILLLVCIVGIHFWDASLLNDQLVEGVQLITINNQGVSVEFSEEILEFSISTLEKEEKKFTKKEIQSMLLLLEDMCFLGKGTVVENNLRLTLEKIEFEEEIAKIDKLLTKAEKTKKQTDLNKVKKLLKKLDSENEFVQAFSKRVTKLQKKINKIKEEAEKKAALLQKQALTVSSTPPKNAKVLETLVGSISSYGPDCQGCNGYIATGTYVGDGDVFYYDKTYGKVYIVAGDSSYPYGTIVRLNNLDYFGKDIYAIVLDRGSSIGKNRKRLFDLLLPSEAISYQFGVAYNVKCEILRVGY